MQAAQIIFDDIYSELSPPKELFKKAHDKLCREVGMSLLYNGRDYDQICGRFITEQYNLWSDRHGNPDIFFKLRMSLIELIFRELEDHFSNLEAIDKNTNKIRQFFPKKDNNKLTSNKKYLKEKIEELNIRICNAGLPFHYHNGYIQMEKDQLTTRHIAEPFWALVREPKWTNVDTDIKEAIDRRDRRERDAALYAAKALESTLKIICEDKGWITGKEKGASNFIDNLVSQKNGRFIEIWEGNILKELFTHVRNPHGHGPGSKPQPDLTNEQITWVIESCMSWIKSLISRM